MSTANHPQTGGQTKRVNQCLETLLRCFTQACPRLWSFWISLVQFWYNSSPHSAIGMRLCSFRALQSWLEEHAVIQDLLQQQLNRAQQQMKTQADKRRSFRAFNLGDQFFLKLQPYIQTSAAPHANHKLWYKFFGPFPIIEKVNMSPTKCNCHHTRRFTRCFTYPSCVDHCFLVRVSNLIYLYVLVIWLFLWRRFRLADARRKVLCVNKCRCSGQVPQPWAPPGGTKLVLWQGSHMLRLGVKPHLKNGGMLDHLSRRAQLPW